MTARHEPDDESRRMVDMMVAAGIPQPDIARAMCLDPKTLRKHYREELDAGGAKANASVSRFLFSAATGEALAQGATWADCTRAAIFWAKTRMGWTERQAVEHSGPDGGPIQHEEIGADADAFTRRMARLAAGGGTPAGDGEAASGDEGKA